ncbi:MAG: peptidylprolyl isomerase [Fibrobacter sp.]|nr:peptidylprolyl isomerase [Fibrobacter sp.]
MSAKIGDTVRVLYTGKLKDETVFDSSDGEPLEFVIGDGMVIPGFEEAVIGMDVGQHKTVEVSSKQAYGPHLDGLVATVGKDQFPEAVMPEKGKQIRVANQLGQTFIMTIIDVRDSSVTLDANHPLAGKDLVFDIDLVQIN